MQPLRDYLNESPLQHESILDPNQSKIMGRMTDDMIRRRIKEYCASSRQKYDQGELWSIVREGIEITKIDKDKQGWYIETKSTLVTGVIYGTMAKSFYDVLLSEGCKMDAQKGFLIEDIGVYFRWRKHHGTLEIGGSPNLESTQGLPEELNALDLVNCCQKSKKIDIRNKINVILLAYAGDIKISGNGYKNILIDPNYPCGNITTPSGVKIHRPKNAEEYLDLRAKISGC